KASKRTKIILFLDDDAYVGEEYLDEMVGWYNKLRHANGLFGFDYLKFGKGEMPVGFVRRLLFFTEKLVKATFFLGYLGDKEFRITSPYGNTSTLTIDVPVRAEWFPGTDPSFKKEILS